MSYPHPFRPAGTGDSYDHLQVLKQPIDHQPKWSAVPPPVRRQRKYRKVRPKNTTYITHPTFRRSTCNSNNPTGQLSHHRSDDIENTEHIALILECICRTRFFGGHQGIKPPLEFCEVRLPGWHRAPVVIKGNYLPGSIHTRVVPFLAE